MRNGIKLKIKKTKEDKSGLSAFNDVWVRDYYRRRKFKIADSDIVVDIGANTGMFSIYASRHARFGKIFAFEPFKENIKILKENLKLNGIKNVYPFECAVSDRIGYKTLFVSRDNLCHSFHMKQKIKNKVKVKTINLSRIFKENKIKKIDFLKMDCEGAEYEILLGCSKKDLDKIKKICLEYHNLSEKFNCFSLIKFLKYQGFDVSSEKISKDNGYEYGYIYATRD
jgi:FkbM family methyltransferase